MTSFSFLMAEFLSLSAPLSCHTTQLTSCFVLFVCVYELERYSHSLALSADPIHNQNSYTIGIGLGSFHVYILCSPSVLFTLAHYHYCMPSYLHQTRLVGIYKNCADAESCEQLTTTTTATCQFLMVCVF